MLTTIAELSNNINNLQLLFFSFASRAHHAMMTSARSRLALNRGPSSPPVGPSRPHRRLGKARLCRYLESSHGGRAGTNSNAPPDMADAMSDDDVAIVAAWIDAGAEDN